MNQMLENLQHLVGKTLKTIDDKACNCVTITCTDGTVVLLEAENLGPPLGLLAIIPYSVEAPKQRLEYLREELRAERISYEELHELQSLVAHIHPSDVELLEAAGVPEFPE